jgi:hypothetical protein
MSDAASNPLEKLGFNDDEKKRVVKMVEDIYNSLSFRKLKYLLPLEKGERTGKLIDFLKKEIDDNHLFMIYCFNQFVKQSNDEYFLVTINDEILMKDKVYKRLLNSDAPLSEEDKIEVLQEKTNRAYFVTRDIYIDMMHKIENTCEKVLEILGDDIANDPDKLAIAMQFVFDTVRVAQIDSIEIMKKEELEKENEEEEEEEDPCDANRHFGIDWSFLGIFHKLPKECVEKANMADSTKISIVGPVTLVQNENKNSVYGGKSRKRVSKRGKKKLRTGKKYLRNV